MGRLDDSWRSHVFIEPDGDVADGDARGQQENNASAAVWAYYGQLESAREVLREPVPVPKDIIRSDYQSQSQLRSCQGQHCPGGLGSAFLQQEFARGYTDAGGPPAYLDHFINDVIGDCEYGWEPYYPKNEYLSRAQFNAGSWATAGGGDPADDYTVGRNVAHWVGLISEPGGSGGWPVCWWRGTVPQVGG